MKRSRLAIVGIVVAGIVALSLGALPAHGQRRGGMGWRGMMGDGPGMLLPVLLKGANLTPDQDAQVHQIMATHRPVFQTLFSQLRTAHEELADKLYGPNEVDVAELNTQIDHVNQLREQLLREGLKLALEVRGVLTPEQRAKAAEVKDRIRTLRGEMRGLLRGLD